MKKIIITRKRKFASALVPFWIITTMTKEEFKQRFGLTGDATGVDSLGQPVSRLGASLQEGVGILDSIGNRIGNGKTVSLLVGDDVRTVFASTGDGGLSNEIELGEGSECRLTLTVRGGWKTASVPYFEAADGKGVPERTGTGLFGLFGKKKKEPDPETPEPETPEEKPTLAHDIPIAAEWAKNNLNATGYHVDYDLQSMEEVERFFREQSAEGGVLTGKCGSILFGLGCLVGETIIRVHGGRWETDDDDPKGEVNITVRLPDGSKIWPVQRCMKRLANGPEDNIHDYVMVMTGNVNDLEF